MKLKFKTFLLAGWLAQRLPRWVQVRLHSARELFPIKQS